MVKLFAQLIWEAAILPVIRFIIGYLPMIVGVFVTMEDTIKYFITSMVQYGLLEWLVWYIPAILIVSLTFGVMASNVKKIHPIGMALILISSLIGMKWGVSEMQISFFYGDPPMLMDALSASIFAVVSVYCIALMVQKAWVDFLPKRKRWYVIHYCHERRWQQWVI